MNGTVVGQEAVLRLEVVGREDEVFEVGAIIDTGFTGFLTLPSDAVQALQLPLVGSQRVILGDGTTASLGIYPGAVIWDGQRREVLMLQADSGPLIGMSLLQGHRVVLHVVDGGDVVIEPWP